MDCRRRVGGDFKGRESIRAPRTADARQPAPLVKPDIMARLRETWADGIFSTEEVADMRIAELEGEALAVTI